MVEKKNSANFGLYIHIPFCKKKCLYCDFHSSAGQESVPEVYVQALLRELEQHRPYDAQGSVLRPCTLYFGGGTPGLLSPRQTKRLIEAVNPLPGAEITMELNPESTKPRSLQGFLQAGVNRISLGVQTARDSSLRRLGRLHTASMAKKALQEIQAAGFQNISGDLMLSLPQYSETEFMESLALLLEGGVCHISAYLLKVEENTPFGRQVPQGLPSEDEAASFYLFAAKRLQEAGFARYEISNFAKPRCESRHNLLYWNCEDYLGLGPAAHSCLGGRRFSYAADTAGFIQGDCKVQYEGDLSAEDYLMLGLRLQDGFSKNEWKRRFGAVLRESQVEKLHFYAKKGLCIQTREGWALTDHGFLVQNSLLAELLE